MTNCRTPEELTEDRINRVLTQYRESPKLLHLLRTYLRAASATHLEVCRLPEAFDIDSAIGDQLTILGKRLGWPRCHCICDVEPVFGFDCQGIELRPVTGFCDPSGSWVECSTGLSEVCLSDDELYRKFLKVRRYQYLNQYGFESLETCLRIFFGDAAVILYSGQGRVVVAPGRDLSQSEILLLQLYPRVLPLALGIQVRFHFGETRVFGFGTGWGGFFEDDWTSTYLNKGYLRTEKVFGFCDDWGGFCEDWETEGLPLVTGELDADGNEIPLVDENGIAIYTGPLVENAAWLCKASAPWMCEIDVHPYDC